jgi:hypothetical protein
MTMRANFTVTKVAELGDWNGKRVEITRPISERNNVAVSQTNKRIWGIARRCQRTFGLPYEQLQDLTQSAWMYFLIHGELAKVWAPLRREVIKGLFGYVPHQSRITGIPRLEIEPLVKLDPKLREFLS